VIIDNTVRKGGLGPSIEENPGDREVSIGTVLQLDGPAREETLENSRTFLAIVEDRSL
jgi:hypothetical protein